MTGKFLKLSYFIKFSNFVTNFLQFGFSYTHKKEGTKLQRHYFCFFRCEGFSTYPRTYDLIHASGLFSLYQDK